MRRELELRGGARRTSARDSITGGKGNARAYHVLLKGYFDSYCCCCKLSIISHSPSLRNRKERMKLLKRTFWPEDPCCGGQ